MQCHHSALETTSNVNNQLNQSRTLRLLLPLVLGSDKLLSVGIFPFASLIRISEWREESRDKGKKSKRREQEESKQYMKRYDYRRKYNRRLLSTQIFSVRLNIHRLLTTQIFRPNSSIQV